MVFWGRGNLRIPITLLLFLSFDPDDSLQATDTPHVPGLFPRSDCKYPFTVTVLHSCV